MDDIEYHLLPAEFMTSVFGTHRRVVHDDDGTTVIQLAEEVDWAYGATEVYEAEVITESDDKLARRANADFLRAMFGE